MVQATGGGRISLRPQPGGGRNRPEKDLGVFTGIITATARISTWKSQSGGRRLVLDRRSLTDGADDGSSLAVGESIAINGCCLTLVAHDQRTLSFDVVAETLRRTALEDLGPGSRVNLERALRVGDRLGGHYVTGHIDAVGRIRTLDRGSRETVLHVSYEPQGDFQVLPKGSVAVDGISLTVVEASPREFSVALIPHTLEQTNLRDSQPGARVNLEMDHIAKWVKHLVAANTSL